VDTGQPVAMPKTRGQLLLYTVTIDDVIPFHIHINSDVEVSLVSMYAFLTL
jgi:hypothetical protein